MSQNDLFHASIQTDQQGKKTTANTELENAFKEFYLQFPLQLGLPDRSRFQHQLSE